MDRYTICGVSKNGKVLQNHNQMDRNACRYMQNKFKHYHKKIAIQGEGSEAVVRAQERDVSQLR